MAATTEEAFSPPSMCRGSVSDLTSVLTVGSGRSKARRPQLDPHGQYHQPTYKAGGRAMYGHRPEVGDPHVVIEYREILFRLDKIKAKAFLGLQAGAVEPLSDNDDEDDEGSMRRREDEGAVALAAAMAAMTADSAMHNSESLLNRLHFTSGPRSRRTSLNSVNSMSAVAVAPPAPYCVDPVTSDPIIEDSDDDSMGDIPLNMANTKITFDVQLTRCQIPHDYLDLMRQFVAQYPTQHRPISIERSDGRILQPYENEFQNGETIVFREYAMGDSVDDGRLAGLDFDWERHHAEGLRDGQDLRGDFDVTIGPPPAENKTDLCPSSPAGIVIYPQPGS